MRIQNGFSILFVKAASQRAASAPSPTIASCLAASTAKIADSGGLRIAEKLPPSISSCRSRPAHTRCKFGRDRTQFAKTETVYASHHGS